MIECCLVVRVSFVVIMILYDYFEVDKVDLEDIKGY